MLFINTVSLDYSALQCLLMTSARLSSGKSPELSLDFVHNKTYRAVNPGHCINQPFKDIIKITLLYQYCIVRKLYGKDKI